MIVFYTTYTDGTLMNLSLDRSYEESRYIDISKRDFIIARQSLHNCKIIDGKLVIPAEAKETAEKVLKEYYKERVISLIREQWSIDDEFNLINMRDENPEEYQAYRNKVSELKNQAKRDVYGD